MSLPDADTRQERHALDLSPLLVEYFDVHLVFLMLQHLSDSAPMPYPKEVVTRTQIELLKHHAVSPNGISFLQEKVKELTGVEDPAHAQLMTRYQADFQQMISDAKPMQDLLDSPEKLKSAQNCASIEEANRVLEAMGFGHTLSEETLDKFYSFARYIHGAYLYDMARQCLTNYRMLMQKWNLDVTFDRQISVLYGQVASSILSSQWDLGADFLVKLDELLEASTDLSKSELLKHRAWILHWMLFLVFIPSTDANKSTLQHVPKVLSLFLSEKYFCLMTLRFPHLLRYVCAAYLVSPKLRYMQKDILHVLNEHREAYSDPLTSFLLALFFDFDFELAASCLDSNNAQSIAAVATIDYFVAKDKDAILDSARMMLFETYTKIHRSVDIRKLATMMGMAVDATETWIVGLIRSGKMQARIDTEGESKKVIMEVELPDPVSQVYEKTREMGSRLYVLDRIKEEMVAKKSLGMPPDVCTSMSAELAKHLQPPTVTVSSFMDVE